MRLEDSWAALSGNKCRTAAGTFPKLAPSLMYEQLPTLKDRMEGAKDQLVELGFPVENITDAPMVKDDTEGGFNAANIAINKNPDTKLWIAFGSSDSVTIGAVRALEGQGFTAENVIAVGINGDAFAINEFEKENVTPFFASVMLDARQHGYDTARLMYEWITKGEASSYLDQRNCHPQKATIKS